MVKLRIFSVLLLFLYVNQPSQGQPSSFTAKFSVDMYEHKERIMEIEEYKFFWDYSEEPEEMVEYWNEKGNLIDLHRSTFRPEVHVPVSLEEFKLYGETFFFSGKLKTHKDIKRYYWNHLGEKIEIANRDHLLGGVRMYNCDDSTMTSFLDSVGLKIRINYDFCTHEISTPSVNSVVIFERKDERPFSLYFCPELKALRKKFGDHIGYVIQQGAHFMGYGNSGYVEFKKDITREAAIELLDSVGLILPEYAKPLTDPYVYFKIPDDWNLSQCNIVLEKLHSSSYFENAGIDIMGMRCTTE